MNKHCVTLGVVMGILLSVAWWNMAVNGGPLSKVSVVAWTVLVASVVALSIGGE